MDRLLSVVNKVNTVPVEPVVEENYDQDLFKNFTQYLWNIYEKIIRKMYLPVWSNANRSEEDLISLADDEKKAIFARYYNDMKSRRIFGGKRDDIIVLFDAKLG